MSGARGVLINITGGDDITLHEVDQAVNRIREESSENANFIWGLTNDKEYNGKFKISVISTGIESETYLKNKINDIELNDFDNTSNVKIIDKNDNKLEKNDLLSQQNNFFIDLTSENKKEQSEPKDEIRALEKKAESFKIESEQKKAPKSIFGRIFGLKPSSKQNDEEISFSEEKIENNILKKEESPDSAESEIILENKSIDGQENTFFAENEELDINNKKNSGSDDDLLEIPAFLRRQAN